ncbi:MAG: DUF4292 domain-containing protein [Bacteroidales bacterium]
MSRSLCIMMAVVAGLLITQCSAKRKIAGPELKTDSDIAPPGIGIEGFRAQCVVFDTIQSILISKAETLLMSNDERYESLVTIYSIRDSLIYMSAVNNGFEILRAVVNKDSIMVIDRINKVVYCSLVEKRLGYQNPVNFKDIQNLVSRYYLCDEIENAREIDFSQMGFQFNESQITKSILLNRETLLMDRFEFVHGETKKYFRGERSEEGFKIYSNFMVQEFEVLARGGVVSYNQSIDVKMEMNRKKYSFVNF